MNPFDPAATITRTARVARRLRALRPGSALAATLAALPRFAHASTGGKVHVYVVVAAFGVLVVAAIGASLAAARSRRDAPTRAEPDTSDDAYRPDQRIQQYPDC